VTQSTDRSPSDRRGDPGSERRERGEVAPREVWLLDEHHAREATRDPDPHADALSLPEPDPREQRQPQRRCVVERQHIGGRQVRERVERAHDPQAARHAACPQVPASGEHDRRGGGAREHEREDETEQRPSERHDAPVAHVAQRVRQRAHRGAART
jgi:hypothetical protein